LSAHIDQSMNRPVYELNDNDHKLAPVSPFNKLFKQ